LIKTADGEPLFLGHGGMQDELSMRRTWSMLIYHGYIKPETPFEALNFRIEWEDQNIDQDGGGVFAVTKFDDIPDQYSGDGERHDDAPHFPATDRKGYVPVQHYFNEKGEWIGYDRNRR
jgi:hypothetical protein